MQVAKKDSFVIISVASTGESNMALKDPEIGNPQEIKMIITLILLRKILQKFQLKRYIF